MDRDAYGRRSSDSLSIYKFIGAVILGASLSSMVILITLTTYNQSLPTSPNSSMNMYEKYKSHSINYSDQLYNRVGEVTDLVTTYQRTTQYRLDVLEKEVEALRSQLKSQVHITNTNTNSQGMKP